MPKIDLLYISSFRILDINFEFLDISTGGLVKGNFSSLILCFINKIGSITRSGIKLFSKTPYTDRGSIF